MYQASGQTSQMVRSDSRRIVITTDLSLDFFNDGVTGLDERYFHSQQDRQRLETSFLIPQLKKYTSTSQNPPKRARLG